MTDDEKRFDDMVEAACCKNVREGFFKNNLPAKWHLMNVDALAAALNDPKRHSTPQSTIDAIMHGVHARGLDALLEPDNLERLQRCDEAAHKQIETRLATLRQKGFLR